jgi:uncharacterized protein (DUF1330 family)
MPEARSQRPWGQFQSASVQLLRPGLKAAAPLGGEPGDGVPDRSGQYVRELFVTCLGGSVAAYVIYQGEVLDQMRYDEYKAKAAESILAAGGRYVVRGGDVEVLEGEAPAGRTVVLEFPTRQAAIDWYRSDEYTEIRKIREGAARARMYVVDGVTAPIASTC